MESGFGARLSKLIEALGIKKVRFAERIKVDQSYITQLTKGRNEPSDRIIASICSEFNVNESWLRTGEGEMFIPTTRSQEIAGFVGDILKGEEDNFKRRFVAMLARLNESEWEFIEQKALELFEGTKKD